VRLALAQINPVVGDLDGNRRLILERLDEARSNAADLVLFPELAVTGYPPEDLLLRPGFVRAAESSVEEIAREARGTTVLVRGPHFDRDLYHACYLLSGGEVKAY
jgi:NAD+ synthase (glutamine-hydrolysing)